MYSPNGWLCDGDGDRVDARFVHETEPITVEVRKCRDERPVLGLARGWEIIARRGEGEYVTTDVIGTAVTTEDAIETALEFMRSYPERASPSLDATRPPRSVASEPNSAD